MALHVYVIKGEHGGELNAHFSVSGKDIVVHSRGGAKGSGATNSDYAGGLRLILDRLKTGKVSIQGAWVDSITVQALPLEARSILSADEGSEEPARILSLLSARMRHVRGTANPEAKGGNSTRRIRIRTGFIGPEPELAAVLGGVPFQGDSKSDQRLPAELLNLASPDLVWMAVQRFLAGPVQHPFGESTDFDLIADDGIRLAPKAVFGVALSTALEGAEVLPRHFAGGEDSACFRLLRAAGYQVIPKADSGVLESPDEDPEQEWPEGKKELRAHLRRERAPGLAKAKKAQFVKTFGKLKCERCNRDPVAEYGTDHATSCIEVHHASTQLARMFEDHKTKLDDLQCLCANCHRLVHRLLRVQALQPQ